MLDFSIIKNEKLRDLVKSSHKFQTLSEFQQEKHLQSMKDLFPEQEEKLIKFFTEENIKDNAPITNEEKLEILSSLYSQLVQLEEKFTKLLKKDPENKQRENDDDDMNNLLTSLNN